MFSAILEGECWLEIDGRREPLRLEAGDVGLLPGTRGFRLCSSLDAKPAAVEPTDSWGEMITIGDGTGCTWLAGRVSLLPASAELLTRSLPDLVHVRSSSTEATTLRWIVQELVSEHMSSRAGSSIAVAHLAQVFFVKILRAHLASRDALPVGWLRAMTDDRLLPALRLIHTETTRPLGLDELARAAGMSRTRFAVHFKAIAGMPPLAYVTAWRMRIAQTALRDGQPVARIASSLGYASESAFSTAFKRVVGVTPGGYRKRLRA